MKKRFCLLCLCLIFSTVICFCFPSGGFGIVAEAASIRLNKKALYITQGQSFQLKVTGTKETVKWKSSNKKIAIVNSKGKVRGVKVGTATVTATVKGKKYSCKVKVENPSISNSALNLAIGDSATLKMKGTKQSVKWTTSDEDIVAVSQKGAINCMDEGRAVITAKVGSKKYKCLVNVAGIEIASTDKYILLNETCQVSLSPKNSSVIWESENPHIANVSEKGVVTGIATGTAIISGTVGDKTYQTEVVVENPYLSRTSISLQEGESATIDVEGTSQEVVWDTRDPRVVSVAKSGKVVAIKEGSAVVAAKVGGKEYVCNVTVTKSKESLMEEVIKQEEVRHQNALIKIQIDAQAFRADCEERIRAIQRETTPYYGSYSDYSAKVSALTKEITGYERSIMVLSGDDSEEAKSKTRKLQANLTTAQQELDRLEASYSARDKVDALEDLARNYETNMTNQENELYYSNLTKIREQYK